MGFIICFQGTASNNESKIPYSCALSPHAFEDALLEIRLTSKLISISSGWRFNE